MISEQTPGEGPKQKPSVDRSDMMPSEASFDWSGAFEEMMIRQEETVKEILMPLQNVVSVDDMFPPDDGQPALVPPVKPDEGPDGGQAPDTVGDPLDNIIPDIFEQMLKDFLAELAKEKVG